MLNLLFASTSAGANRSYYGSSYTSIKAIPLIVPVGASNTSSIIPKIALAMYAYGPEARTETRVRLEYDVSWYYASIMMQFYSYFVSDLS